MNKNLKIDPRFSVLGSCKIHSQYSVSRLRHLGCRICVLLFLLVSSIQYPESIIAKGAGTEAGEFLKIGIGARAIGMGEAFVAVADDSSAVYWNPAGLAGLRHKEVSFMDNESFVGIRQNFTGYIQPLGKGSFGSSINFLSYGKIPGYDEEGKESVNLSAYDLAPSLAYGRKIRKDISVGTSLKLIQQKLAAETARTFGIDFGLLWRNFFLRDLTLGVICKNIGPGPRFWREKEKLPGFYLPRTGLAYRLRLFNRDLAMALDVQPWTKADKTYFTLGGEYWLWDWLGMRVGYRHAESLAQGIRTGFGLDIRNILFDYALAYYGSLGFEHRFSLAYRFGEPEEIKRIREHLKPGRKYFRKGKLIEAREEFRAIIALDSAHKEAKEYLERIETRFKDVIAALYSEGLAHYEAGEYEKAIKQWEGVLKINPEHQEAKEYLSLAREKLAEIERQRKLKEIEKDYQRGLSFYLQGKWEKAIRILEKIEKTEPGYKNVPVLLKKAKKKLSAKLEKEKMEQVEKYYQQGLKYVEGKEWLKAKAQFEKALQLAPTHKAAKSQLEKLLLQLKEEAKKYYTEGLKHYTKGEIKKAIRLWETAVEMDPGHERARRALESARKELKERKE